jgi:RNA polymerase sigma-70 factor (ECF subfamily)
VEEQQAIARLKQGDLQGLEALVSIYQLRAVRAAALITGDRILAEDIVQNAFIRVAERIEQYDFERPFGPWFLRSVVNEAIKAAGRQKRFVSLDEEFGEGAFDLSDTSSLPEEVVETHETKQAVWRALQKLPPNQRAAVVLRYYLGMSEDEMTKELQVPAGSIKWRLYAARQRLAKLLSREISPLANVQKSGDQQ